MILAGLACHYPHFCAKCARIPQAERGASSRAGSWPHTCPPARTRPAPPEIILSSL